jgi:hypothetical protein
MIKLINKDYIIKNNIEFIIFIIVSIRKQLI